MWAQAVFVTKNWVFTNFRIRVDDAYYQPNAYPSPVFHSTRSSALNNGFLVSWNLHPFHLIPFIGNRTYNQHRKHVHKCDCEKKKKKRKVKGLVAKRKISENAKQSEIWPRVRRVTQWTEKSPFLSQCNNITNLFGGVMYFPWDTSTDGIPVK